jgi:hypothetical protein
VLPAVAEPESLVDEEDVEDEGVELIDVDGGLKLLLLIDEPLLKPP